ncbi:MAG: putative L-galactonate transporter [Steroidobacteraceae bacterium]|nr:putative L-galactonate transporter [Steroidobacteraceae bacterium]
MTRLYRAYVLCILLVVYTFNFIDRVIVGILAEPIKRDLALTDTQLGLMSGVAFALFYTLLGIPIARLADRASRTWIMTAALAVWSGCTALCGQALSFAQLFAARVGVGVGEAGGVAPAFSLISDYFPPQQRARALAVFSFGVPIGSGLGMLFGGLVASAVDWRIAFVAVGLGGLVLAPVFGLTVREPLRGALDRPPEGPEGPEGPDGGSTGAGVRPLRDDLRGLVRKRSFVLLTLGAASSSVVGYGLLFWLPSFFIRSHGLTLAQTAWFVGIGTMVFGIAGIWFGGWVGDRLGARRKAAYAAVPAVMLLAIVPFLAAAVLVPSTPLAFALFSVPMALNASWTGPVYSALQHLVAPRMRATASAIFLFMINLIGIGGGTLFVGALSDFLAPRFGADALRYAIVIATLFYFVSGAFFWAAARRLAAEWYDGGATRA